MEFRFGSWGRLGVECSQCGKIAYETVFKFESKIFNKMDDMGCEWFCEECMPEREKQIEQSREYLHTLNALISADEI